MSQKEHCIYMHLVDRLHSQSKIPYNEMLFFDDNESNIIEIPKPGM